LDVCWPSSGPLKLAWSEGYRISEVAGQFVELWRLGVATGRTCPRIWDTAVACRVMSDTMTDRAEPAQASSPSEGMFVRAIRFVGWASVWLGLFLLGFVAHQLFVTTFFAQQNNAVLEAEAEEYFDSAEITELAYVAPNVSPGVTDGSEPGNAPVEPGSADSSGVAATPVRLLVESPPPEHEAFAIIRIPSIERLHDGWAVVEGVGRSDLKNGAGHMPSTPLPGQPGNSVISGHRTTYGAPFHELDQLVSGDEIQVETGLGVHTYEVRETIIVRPTEIWVTEQRQGAWLTLTTCHPKFSARQRLVIFAELVEGPNSEAING
jgi:sortase A